MAIICIQCVITMYILEIEIVVLNLNRIMKFESI